MNGVSFAAKAARSDIALSDSSSSGSSEAQTLIVLTPQLAQELASTFPHRARPSARSCGSQAPSVGSTSAVSLIGPPPRKEGPQPLA
jgi:hypothetical protein